MPFLRFREGCECQGGLLHMFLTKSPEAPGRRRNLRRDGCCNCRQATRFVLQSSEGLLVRCTKAFNLCLAKECSGLDFNWPNKQTKTVRVWRRAEQISSMYLAFAQVESAIYLDGIWHLNHSQVLWPDKIPGKRTVLALGNAKA